MPRTSTQTRALQLVVLPRADAMEGTVVTVVGAVTQMELTDNKELVEVEMEETVGRISALLTVVTRTTQMAATAKMVLMAETVLMVETVQLALL